MKPVPVFIHVGLMKTATTTLQLRVSPAHNELNYLGGPDFQHDSIRQAIAAISKQDRLLYDQGFHEDEIQNVLDDASKKGKPVLISAESLTTPTVDRLTKAERLVGLFGDIRIVLCLRKPEDLMTSLYSESIKHLPPGTRSIPSIDDWLAQEWSDQRATRHTRILDFSRLIRAYQNLVGEENVCVLLFEDLRNDPEAYARQLSEFLGISSQRTLELLQVHKENTSVNKLDYKLLKLSSLLGSQGVSGQVSRYLPRPIKEIIKKSMSGTKQFSMSDEWRERIRAYCREDSQDLCKLIGSGPERYDYF